jgi:hypothetical protein
MGLNNVLFDPDQPTGSKFPSLAVQQEIAAIVPIDLDPGSVTGDKLADQTVGTEQLANGAVTAQQIANGTIDTANYGDGSITGAKIAAGAIDAANCGAGVISVTDISGNSIVLKAVKCSSSDYSALSPPDPNTLYIITS